MEAADVGTDNEKQLQLGNICGWVRYDPAEVAKGNYKMVPGVGQGVGMALEVIDELRREFPIDDRRIYVTGQSMGGAGTWNAIASRPGFFAAAVICCGSTSIDDGTGSIATPVCNFHGDADKTVPVAMSRDRIAARRRAGGHPLSTEYARVDHNVWQWAYTEPAVVKWLFANRSLERVKV